jgi:ubiquinone biosynthesis accessory factor UbiJ
MLKKYSLKALEIAVNQALALDEASSEKLEALSNKVLQLIIEPLNILFFIEFKDKRMLFIDTYEGHVDTVIHSNPIGFIRLSLLPASKARSLFNDKIRISGDLELGQQVKKLFDELDIDWEGHMAEFTGDVVAHQLGSWVRQGMAHAKEFGESMRLNTSEYLLEEMRLFPSHHELNGFYKDIDELALRVERLQAQIHLLTAKKSS